MKKASRKVSEDLRPRQNARPHYEGPGGRSLVLNANFDAWSANVTPVK
jgi:hypothetical protein